MTQHKQDARQVCVLADENHLVLLNEIPNFRIFGLCQADVEYMLALNASLN
jgi:hypothetical protein